MNWWNAVLPIVTLVLGWGGSLVTEERRDARTRALTKQDREEADRAARTARREEFELQNLRELYDALNQFSRMAAMHHNHDVKAAKASGRRFASFVTDDPDGIGESYRVAGMRLRSLSDLVLDDSIRTSVQTAQSMVTEHLLRPTDTVNEAEARFDQVVLAVIDAQGQIGARIRELYKDAS